MSNSQYSEYFLGANTPGGFRSMFEQSYSREDGWRIMIIKGGPGTGKSTLMRRVAEKAAENGIFAERIHCSSDPDSLDAVIIPSVRRAIYDGTAPHVLEAVLPGACEQLLDLGQAWNSDLLHERKDAIADYSGQCSALHRQATHMLACAEVFRARLREPAMQTADRQKVSRAADRLCDRFGLSRRSSSGGTVSRRLASAVTPNGIVNIAQDYIHSFDVVVPLLDRSFAVSGLLLSELSGRFAEQGRQVIECPCSQDHRRLEHLLLPDEGICFTTRSDMHGAGLHSDSDTRAVRAERFLPEELTKGRRPDQLSDRRELMRFTSLASDCMRKAKEVHDLLEACYRDAMDFEQVRQLGDKAIGFMLG